MAQVQTTINSTQLPGQQQVVVIQQAPTSSRPKIYEKYCSGQSKGLGITQIVLGLLAIFFNALAIHFEGDGDGDGISYSGMGIWSGLWFILTGAFGYSAGQRKTLCPIVTFMVLSIISVSTWNIAFLALAAAGVGSAADGSCDYSSWLISYSYNCPVNEGLLALMSLLLIISLIEIVVAIWSSIICCHGVCCCNTSYNQTAPIHYVNSPQGGQVMFLQNGATTAYTTGYTIQNQGMVMTNTQMVTGGYPMQTNPPMYQPQQQQQPQQPPPQQMYPPQQQPPPNPAYPPPAQPNTSTDGAGVPAPPVYQSGPPPAYAPAQKN